MNEPAPLPPKKPRKKPETQKHAIHHAWRRHPLTQRLYKISAPTKEQLHAFTSHVDTMRREYRLGMRTRQSLDHALRRLRYGDVTLEQAALKYIEQPTLKKETKRRTESFLDCLDDEMKTKSLDDLDIPTVSKWLERLGGPPRRLIASTRQTCWWTLSAIVRFAAERGWIDGPSWGTWRPKFRDRTRPRGRESLRTVSELVSLLDAARAIDRETDGRAKGWCVPASLQAQIAVSVLAGLRDRELCGLRWHDLNPAACTLTIARQGADGAPTKTRRIDVIEVLPELFELLGAHRERLQAARLYDARGPVFPMPKQSIIYRKPRPFPEKCIETRALRRAITRAGLPTPERWSRHSLKDSFATLEQEKYGHDLYALKDRTRHATLKGLVRYLHSRSREPATPGFRLPPGALHTAPASQLLLPQTTTAPTEADAAEGARR